jgi:putative phosphoribosyl transferase
MLYRDRFEAGQVLAAKLADYRDRPNVSVFGLARGGIPVAFEVAQALRAPLDVFIVRKLGFPGQEELAMGAVATGDVQVLNEDVVQSLRVPERLIQAVAKEELIELKRREALYRGGRAAPQIEGRVIILVDDGLATGTSMRAAIQAIKKQKPRRLVVAVPVGAADTCVALRDEVDDLICAATPDDFSAVGVWYEDFAPTSDEQVQTLLDEAAMLHENEVLSARP